MTVKFICRYRCESDYMVDGVRVSIHDSGHAHSLNGVTSAQREAIRLYELQRYAEYVQWHVENTLGRPLQPFTCAA